jgi:hypothetical protein
MNTAEQPHACFASKFDALQDFLFSTSATTHSDVPDKQRAIRNLNPKAPSQIQKVLNQVQDVGLGSPGRRQPQTPTFRTSNARSGIST